jgi:hypothetical protein
MSALVLTLTHYERGPMRVSINEEHSYNLRRRVWDAIDTDGRLFEDNDFDECPAEIEAKLMEAFSAAHPMPPSDAADELYYETATLANYCKE